MITKEINVLREKLEKQIINNESYDIIYKTAKYMQKENSFLLNR